MRVIHNSVVAYFLGHPVDWSMTYTELD